MLQREILATQTFLPQYREIYYLSPVKTMSLQGEVQKSCKLAFFFFPHCAFHLFPQQPLSLPILHILLSWMEPSPDAHCRSDHELLSSGYSKLEEGWENSYEGPHNSTHSRNRQLKIKENAFSLAICFGRWKLVSIIPNASWSTVLQLVETGHCWNNKDIVMWDKAAVKSLLSSEKDPSRAAKALWVQK